MKQLYVVGIGPGDKANMTYACDAALREADVIVGYRTYVKLVQPLYPDKQYVDSPMLQEVARCTYALQLADEGRTVAVVCSGDGGVYGMAGLIYELAGAFPEVVVTVVPGVTAALAGAALLGAPLTDDFATVSLSNLLTPWEQIEKRLSFAALADFAICLYNPSSNKRHDHLQRACDILLRHKPGDTMCGYVRQIGREGECVALTTLKELRDTAADMFTTVFIGSSKTRELGGKLVTLRGYAHE